jgi:hypothetical protein
VDRHLLPDEIDQLLDGEVGFGTAPLKAHVRRCPECRRELEEAHALVRSLESLPHFAPSPAFADEVMARVPVFVPWYASLLDTVRGWAPRSTGARAAALAGTAGVTVVLTVAMLWAIARLDEVMFALNLVVERGRIVVGGAASDAVAAVFGEPAMQILRASGPLGFGAALVALLLAAAIATRMLRALTAGTTRR